MKAILFLAVLVIAAQAGDIEVHSHTPAWAVPFVHLYETLNIEQNQAGFADELGLNETVRAQGKVCTDAVLKSGKTIVDIVKKGQNNKVLLAVEAVGILETAKTQIIEACQPYFETLGRYAVENGSPVDQDYKSQVIRQSFAQQYFFETLDTIIAKKAYEYGRVQGRSFKLGAGIDKASRANQYEQFNSTKVKPVNSTFNMHTFSTEFWPAFLKTIGQEGKFDVNDFIKCGDEQTTINQRIEEIKKNADNSFLGRLGAKVKIAEEIAKLGKDCWVEVELMLPLLNKAKENPIHFLLTTQHNGGINAGQLGWLALLFSENIEKTDYTLAGDAMGTMMKIQYQGI